MLHCLNSCGNLDTTVLERQSSKWQEPYFPATELNAVFSSVKPDPALSAHVEGGSSSSKKRKPHTHSHPKVVPPPETAKRVKASAEEEESRVSNKTAKSNREATSADTSKGSQVQHHNKPDYIHVRARRGQATDSHSLAERVRREKISERMKYLQDLVPGCNKIAGKAGMLDEIINYVQSLQRQVEFLSMKLAAVNPRLDCNIDELFAKEVFPSCCQSFPNIGMASDMTNNPAYLQFNSAQQLVSCCGGLANNMGISPTNMGIQRNISNTTATTTPVPLLPEPSFDSSCFAQLLPSSNWEGDLQSLYSVSFGQERTASFLSQPFTDLVEASNLKMEM